MASERPGYKFFGRDSKNKQHHFIQEWIDVNFKLQYPDFYKQIHDPQVDRNSFHVPKGAASSAHKNPWCLIIPKNGPKMQYMQGDHSSCVLSSFALALHAIKDECTAAVINDAVSFALSSGLPPMNYAMNLMSDRLCSKNQQSIRYHLAQWKENNHFLFLDEISPYPILVVLTTQSMNQSHCVTLWGRWIFDSNYEHAFPLEVEWLEFVSSMIDESAICNNAYLYVKHAIWFFPPPAVEARMNNLLK